MGMYSAWVKYYNGEPSNNIGPFKNVQASGFNFKYNKNVRNRINSYRRLMDYMIAHCKEHNC